MSVLEVVSISQAQAIQRAGRAGRCADGKCYRLYTKQDYEQFDLQATPEILRTSLSEILLNLFAARINSLKGFRFLDNPKEEEWCAALDELMALELVEAKLENKSYNLGEYLELEDRYKFG
jgi:HrpA-like RNA helicase